MRRSKGLRCAASVALAVLSVPLFIAVSADAQTGALPNSPVAQGRAIFTQSCSGCHGADLTGGRGPSLFNPRLFARLTDAAIHRTVETGIKDSEMPPFAGTLSGSQIDAVIAYLHDRSRQLTGPAATGPLPAATNGPAPRTQMIGGPLPDPDGQRVHTRTQDIQLKILVDDLDTPFGLAFLPDGRLLITERAPQAALRLVDPTGKKASIRVAGLPRVHEGQDAGLLDVAIGPNYAKDGWIYLAYSDDDPNVPEPPAAPPDTPDYLVPRKPSLTVIVRGKLDANNRWVDQQDIFRAPWSSYSTSGMHYGSRIAFDGKGHLLFSIGERGDMKKAQDLGHPAGKIHRLNLDGTIPADNPFVKTPRALPSIWSFGHRNPEGLAIDPATGIVWESEHGPSGGDEVNIIEPGKNYGWGVVSKGMQPGIKDVSAPNMVEPVAWYFPTIAPSGIAFYEGTRYAGWKGSLLLSALRGQQLRRLTIEGRQVVSEEVLFSGLGRVRAIATGPDGLLYALMTDPTGPGYNVNFTEPVHGELVRIDPITWKQAEFKFQ
ncbi:MAG: PQQ-dependent sugar dehydrogenase [Sphingobium sp.]|nr:PQQ-dependent sugar dehydrogenase [Sphingobium sp.]